MNKTIITLACLLYSCWAFSQHKIMPWVKMDSMPNYGFPNLGLPKDSLYTDTIPVLILYCDTGTVAWIDSHHFLQYGTMDEASLKTEIQLEHKEPKNVKLLRMFLFSYGKLWIQSSINN